ncbi:hypothetical protein CUC53_04450 [Aeromonas cavernicola]|uniref:Peptidase S1 domain-containing protein n=2 Tax=Aeromonas cavernicola TaxID=1006623 RepID=A0A2H9U7D0_9GAMM|nr:hypothetical protein CUC53_04450 [Aeromonas cavernicola]
MAQPCQAIVISDAVFHQLGGDLNHVEKSMGAVAIALRQQSELSPFLAVGYLPGCTATWLGEQAQWTYLLTAAHCVPYQGEVTPVHSQFISWQGMPIAYGDGVAYVPPARLHRPAGLSASAADIALLKLPTRRPLPDKAGQPLTPPTLYQGAPLLHAPVNLVGYGEWGVGARPTTNYEIATERRRLYGQSRITHQFEHGYLQVAAYEPQAIPPSSGLWARIAKGDSGAAWWQLIAGKQHIVAVTSSGHATASNATAIGPYLPWIASIFPQISVTPRITSPISTHPTGSTTP